MANQYVGTKMPAVPRPKGKARDIAEAILGKRGTRDNQTRKNSRSSSYKNRLKHTWEFEENARIIR